MFEFLTASAAMLADSKIPSQVGRVRARIVLDKKIGNQAENRGNAKKAVKTPKMITLLSGVQLHKFFKFGRELQNL